MAAKMLRWTALLLCLHSLVAFEQATLAEEDDLERAGNPKYFYQRLSLTENVMTPITSQLWSQWFKKYPQSLAQDNRMVYQVQAPAGYQIRASCSFTLRCNYFEYYFSPNGKFPDNGVTKQPCTNNGGQTSNVLLKSQANVFQARYRFSKYAYSHDAAATGFSCLLKACDCGKHSLDEDRIVNGTETSPNKYPFFAALSEQYSTTGRKVFCGASLISNQWIMTAAHCVDFIKPAILKNYQVILGSHDLNTPSVHERTVDMEQIIVHENWNAATVTNDIALIKLRTPIQFNSKISPICLPFNDIVGNMDEENALTMGYGSVKYAGFRTTTLHEVYLRVEPTASCRNTYADYQTQVTDKMICTYVDQKDACQGDSGGPLIVTRNNKMQQVGVVSWGDQCAKKDRPGVYTDVSKYLGWIQENTNDDFCWS